MANRNADRLSDVRKVMDDENETECRCVVRGLRTSYKTQGVNGQAAHTTELYASSLQWKEKDRNEKFWTEYSFAITLRMERKDKRAHMRAEKVRGAQSQKKVWRQRPITCT